MKRIGTGRLSLADMLGLVGIRAPGTARPAMLDVSDAVKRAEVEVDGKARIEAARARRERRNVRRLKESR